MKKDSEPRGEPESDLSEGGKLRHPCSREVSLGPGAEWSLVVLEIQGWLVLPTPTQGDQAVAF